MWKGLQKDLDFGFLNLKISGLSYDKIPKVDSSSQPFVSSLFVILYFGRARVWP